MFESDKQWLLPHSVTVTGGEEALKALLPLVRDKTVLLLTSKGFTDRGVTSELQSYCCEAKEVLLCDDVTPNPELDYLDQKTACFIDSAPDLIVALGGGSVLDSAKVLALTLAQKSAYPLLSRLFRQNEAIEFETGIPVVTIPTTAGTGAEVTPFATIWDASSHRKYSLAGDFMYPKMAILIPHLSLTMPAHVMLHTALDTVSHSLETLWNKQSTLVSKAYAEMALRLSMQALLPALARPEVLQFREQLQLASLWAGMAISVNRTAIAHAISYPVTSYLGVPHGLACSFTLPALIELVLGKNILAEHYSELLQQLGHWLLQLPLYKEFQRYTEWDAVYSLLPHMFTPGRADNFILNLTSVEVEQILKRSEELARLSNV